MLAPLVFNVFFTAVLRVAEKRFTADAVIMDSMVQLRRNKEKRRKKERRAWTGEVDGQMKEEAALTLSGILYSDDAGIVSRPPEGPENGDRNCECRVQADIIGGQDGDHVLANERWGHVPFTVNATGQVYKQTVEFV